MSCPQSAAPVVVGLALKKEKRKKHISDKLVQQAAGAGITMSFIDKEVPLEQQGPFTAILQKVRKPGEAGALLGQAQATAQSRPPAAAAAHPPAGPPAPLPPSPP